MKIARQATRIALCHSSLLVLLICTGSALPSRASVFEASRQAALPDSQWWVEDIDGRGVVDVSHTTIGFATDGRVSGDSGCNRYRGSYLESGPGLEFGALAGTLRACPEALMDQERRFYAAMGQVKSWRIGADDGLLYLLGPGGQVLIRASAIPHEDP